MHSWRRPRYHGRQPQTSAPFGRIFVISGYLITSLLISERDTTRDVKLGAFWFRRARRLLPAVIVLIVGVLTYVALFLPGELAALRGDAVAALLYVSNWYLIFEDQSYFESLARPSLLQHLWSLAVEEQFYIIWPILFAAVFSRLRPRVAAAATLTGAALSAALMFALYEPGTDPSRIYYGTDTRIGGLLVGAALAFVWMPGRLPRAAMADRGIPDTFGALAIVGLAAMCVLVGEYDAFLYQGGFALTALLTAILIAAAVHPSPGPLKSVLGHPLLVWIGVRSYSIYLWHWPVFMLTRPGIDVDLHGLTLFAVRIAITLGLAEISFRFIETPVRRGALGRFWRAVQDHRPPAPVPPALAPAAVVLAVLTGISALSIAVATADPPPPPESLAAESVNVRSWSQRDIDGGLALNIATPTPSPSPVPVTPSPTPLPVPVAAPVETPVITAAPEPVPPPPVGMLGPRVLAVGESVMLGATPGLVNTIPNIEIDAAISRHVGQDLDVLRYRRDTGTLGDIVVLHIGNNGIITEAQFAEAMEILAGVQRVVWVNLKLPARYWEGPNNELIAASAALYPNATVLDWNTAGNSHPDYFLEDGIHLNPSGYYYYAGLIADHAQ
jgi:peptidoglycan/LPS O-acetylase OafA/YrhL